MLCSDRVKEHCVSLIKIDLEGHELEVIRGMIETLEKHKPGLVVEIEVRHVGGVDHMADAVTLLCSFGYRCYGIHGRKLIPHSMGPIQCGALADAVSFRNSDISGLREQLLVLFTRTERKIARGHY